MKFHSLCLTAFAALSFTFAGCSNDDIISSPTGDGEGTQFTLSIGVASRAAEMSRATVGSDEGLAGERQVNDAMIIIYDRPLNSPGDDGKIVKVVYLDNLGTRSQGQTIEAKYVDPNPSYYPQTDVLNYVKVGKVSVSDHYDCPTFSIDESVKPLEVGKRYYATAVCNFGNMVGTFTDMSLKDFREYVYTGKLYTESDDIKSYTNFRMSGINETSFIWQRNATVPLDLGYFLVQRIAARLDVMLGDDGVDFTWPQDNSEDLILNIYTEGEDGKLTKSDKLFYLTDLRILNDVNSGSYLIERSSPFSPSYRDQNNKAAVPMYFDNEGWEVSGSQYLTNATKYVYSPSSKTYRTEYSLVPEGKSLFKLIDAGKFIYDEDVSGNKKYSSIVGYLNENTNSSRYTVLRIAGSTNALTSEIFPTVSRDVPSGDYYKVTGEIPIRHSLNTESDRMRYAIVRNTIYRVRIKVIAREGKIYFRYYYAEPGKDNQKDYTDHTPFIQEVGENTKPGTVTPND